RGAAARIELPRVLPRDRQQHPDRFRRAARILPDAQEGDAHLDGSFQRVVMGDLLYVVMPIYNEQASIGGVVREWKECLQKVAPDHRILILNDGSKDNTAQVLADLAASTPGLEVVNKPNSGHGRTCIMGYEEAIRRGARWIFQIDSDGQCDPQYFASL